MIIYVLISNTRHACMYLIIALQVNVASTTQSKNYILTPNRKRLCKPLIRGSRYSLAKKCLEDVEVKKYLLKCIGVNLYNEIGVLTSKKTQVLTDKSNQAMESFCWSTILKENSADVDRTQSSLDVDKLLLVSSVPYWPRIAINIQVYFSASCLLSCTLVMHPKL